MLCALSFTSHPLSSEQMVSAERKTCLACLNNVYSGRAVLCAPCERYVSQDYVSQREIPFGDGMLGTLGATKGSVADLQNSAELNIRKFLKMLRPAGLTRGQRKLLVLKYFQGKTYSEIAQALGIDKAVAFRRCKRAKRRLRRKLQGGNDFSLYEGEEILSPADGESSGPAASDR